MLSGSPKEVFRRSDIIDAAGLEKPAAAMIADELIKKGVSLPEGILTGDELEKELCKLTSEI